MFDIGVMFWAGHDPATTLAGLTQMGVHRGQLGIPGNLLLDSPHAWKQAAANANFTIDTVFAAFNGEDYADIPNVERTVGFIPQATRQDRADRMLAVSDFAHALAVPSIATHIGFVPHDSHHEDYIAMLDLIRRICDHAAHHGQTFALETGQEPAATLHSFILDVDRANLGINFDPANMILYGTGDPIEALDILAPYVLSVHAKDGDWPAAPGALGHEQPLGQGTVGIPRFIAKLREIGYRGSLAIERESSDPKQRLIDIEQAIDFLRTNFM